MLLAVDVETNTFASGNPYSTCGKLVSIHMCCEDGTTYSYRPDQRGEIQNLLDKASLLLFFNAKFDLAWLRKLNVVLPNKVYDVQLAHFYITNQSAKFPSLDGVAEYYGIPGKIDVVKTEYWDRNIDTDKVPWDILCEYGEQDVKLTLQLYHKQQEHWQSHPQKHKLFKMACMDLLVLQEMEHNGLFYNGELCHQKSEQLQKDIQQLTDKLSSVYPDIPINFNSSVQLSSFLYGGPIVTESKEMVGFYKGGQKAGQPKYKTVETVHQLPRLFKPLPKSEMVKEGVFSTSESTLQKLKGKHFPLVKILLQLAKLTKLDETYYKGLTKLNKEMMWPDNYLHGQFNQCIAVTGRLSSSKPNLQNLSGDSLDIFITRYD
jgi:DNA polymerase-1